ncbi:alpha/beta hydrolase family protein [Arthrobacter sp. NPDC090010]|uniref:alpha/beta hydrolase family protein n=1 Tax=Arthrobacter sp. NPDC090010 TaxID=3363942 RepID=UPI0038309CD1
MIREEVSWQLDDVTMYGTLVRPEGEGPFPGVVLVAGSGPTDRDWNSPLLPGTNGSGRLLAEALAEAGFASLRYDKRASGPHVRENLPRLIGTMSMASHLAELKAAAGLLAGQEFVDDNRIVGLGNSEGCLHVIHYALGDHEPAFAGVILASPPGRAVGEVLLMQLRTQLGQVPGGLELLPLVEEAAARYNRGEAMDLDERLPESVRMVLMSFETPANLPLARELWSEDAADALPGLTQPTLVIIGEKDLQVDVRADGAPLQEAAAGKQNIGFVFPPTANHVLKEETRSLAELAEAPGTGYNEEGTRLDPESLDLVLGWLRENI